MSLLRVRLSCWFVRLRELFISVYADVHRLSQNGLQRVTGSGISPLLLQARTGEQSLPAVQTTFTFLRLLFRREREESGPGAIDALRGTQCV